MKKKLIMIACALSACCTIARPGPFRPVPPPRHFHHLPVSHHHHYSYVSPWLGLTVGTFFGAAIANTANRTVVVQQPTVTTITTTTPIVTAPTIVASAIVQPTQVWIEGHYQTLIQPNGATVQVWVPGHYETR